MIYGAVIACLAIGANAFAPSRSFTVRASQLSMTSTISPATTTLAIAARDARGLAIDSISSVSLFLFCRYNVKLDLNIYIYFLIKLV